MHVPTFGQVATVGMAFFAATALAAPVTEPAQAGLVEVRAEGNAAITGAELVTRTFSKQCKRTFWNLKGNCKDEQYGNKGGNKVEVWGNKNGGGDNGQYGNKGANKGDQWNNNQGNGKDQKDDGKYNQKNDDNNKNKNNGDDDNKNEDKCDQWAAPTSRQ
ncbi:hypothetical protein COL922a_011057, partial [Colletotrichum nupharicola]